MIYRPQTHTQITIYIYIITKTYHQPATLNDL